jgi:hypothetical protein
LDAEGLVEHDDDPAEAEADRSNRSRGVTVHPPHSLLHPGAVPMASPMPLTSSPAIVPSAAPAQPIGSVVPPSGAQLARKLTKQERKVLQERLEQLRRRREAG